MSEEIQFLSEGDGQAVPERRHLPVLTCNGCPSCFCRKRTRRLCMPYPLSGPADSGADCALLCFTCAAGLVRFLPTTTIAVPADAPFSRTLEHPGAWIIRWKLQLAYLLHSAETGRPAKACLPPGN